MNDLIKRLRELHTAKRMAYPREPEAGSAFGDAADALEQASGRERPAFKAGYEAAQSDVLTLDIDEEQAWQQYRCHDDTDWRAVQLSAGDSAPKTEKCTFCDGSGQRPVYVEPIGCPYCGDPKCTSSHK